MFSEHLIQVHLKILSRSVENMASLTLFDKVYYLKYKLSIIFCSKIIYALSQTSLLSTKATTMRPLLWKRAICTFLFIFFVNFNSKGFNRKRDAYVLRFFEYFNRSDRKKKQTKSKRSFPQYFTRIA